MRPPGPGPTPQESKKMVSQVWDGKVFDALFYGYTVGARFASGPEISGALGCMFSQVLGSQGLESTGR